MLAADLSAADGSFWMPTSSRRNSARTGAAGARARPNMLACVGGEANVAVVERFLGAFNGHRLDRLLRLTTANQSVQLPDGTTARGRLPVAKLIAWVLWRSRGTLRMAALSVEP